MASASLLFFFNDTATTEIYTLSLHDALPICGTSRGVPVFEHQAPDAVDNRLRPAAVVAPEHGAGQAPGDRLAARIGPPVADRKSTRLNSSHGYISYAVFCLKKKKEQNGFIRVKNRGQNRLIEI